MRWWRWRIRASEVRADAPGKGTALRGMLSYTMVRFSTMLAAAFWLTFTAVVAADDAIAPLLDRYCIGCHGPEKMKGKVRLDTLEPPYDEHEFSVLEEMLDLVHAEDMPPLGKPQPTAEERATIEAWVETQITLARMQEAVHNGTVRRLTVPQYRNTLRTLLGLEDDLTDILPPDSMSVDGFRNNGTAMVLSPLLLETYFEIAEDALERCIVDVETPPTIETFRVDLGTNINPTPYVGTLILGAGSALLPNTDVLVSELQPEKPFAYEPFVMRTKFRFIEGYQGNGTVRGWRDFDSIYHAVFADMRGQGGYPKGRDHAIVPRAILLRPAIPSKEIFGESTTYGPSANFKIAVRELPKQGRFRITVVASKTNDALLNDASTRPRTNEEPVRTVVQQPDTTSTFLLEHAGIYQLDVHLSTAAKKKTPQLDLVLDDLTFSSKLRSPAFLTMRLRSGEHTIKASLAGSMQPTEVVLTRLNPMDPAAMTFAKFEARNPKLTAHLGLRRDCGSTLPMIGEPKEVTSNHPEAFVFEGALRDFPQPHVEKNNVNYLAGVKEIGVRHAFTDGRDMPRLAVHSVEFQGPFHDVWPPLTHTAIFFDSPAKDNPRQYAKEIIRSFASRAYRRPTTSVEENLLYGVWLRAYAAHGDFQVSIKDALLVALTSPQFLFITEESGGPEAEPIAPYELASKLSYFLWNEGPDKRLLDLAQSSSLHSQLDGEIQRLVEDDRFKNFIESFTSQWLNLAALDTVETNSKLFPTLTRDTKTELRREPIEFMAYLFEHNLPLSNIVTSDFILANEVVASYYGLSDATESGFAFLPIKHETDHLGGLLSQASLLAGLSDGNEPNPVKRGAWFARKMIAEPPDPPPPNVPDLKEDTAHLSLRERLFQHRDQPNCAKCHEGIDPWGIPFEEFNAGGLFRAGKNVDSLSTLPDGTDVANLTELKTYLLDVRLDQLAFSFLKHLATYATGRTLTHRELDTLRTEGVQLAQNGYRVQDMLEFIVKSRIFQTK